MNAEELEYYGLDRYAVNGNLIGYSGIHEYEIGGFVAEISGAASLFRHLLESSL